MRRYLLLIDQHNKDMHKINEQRRLWLYASYIVATGVILLIFGWDWLSGFNNVSIWWVIVSLILLICMNWWYWTMKIIRQLLHHQQSEYKILSEIVKDIKEFKDQLKKYSIDDN